VIFSFGTVACSSLTDSNCIGGDPSVPEPISVLSVGTGLLALLGLGVRAQRRKRAQG
jgi:MYXO-CTERM domain-containing protein